MNARAAIGACLVVSSAPLLYRGITGHWPDVLDGRGAHVRESIRLEAPPAEVSHFWRRFGPPGLPVESDAVAFEPIRGGRGTQVKVQLQRTRRNSSHTIREDLRRFKQMVEAGEIPQATPSA